MDRRMFVLGTAAAAVSASRLLAWRAGAVELGSIDGSVGGNQFTPAQFLDYLSSIKLTWAMISLPPPITFAPLPTRFTAPVWDPLPTDCALNSFATNGTCAGASTLGVLARSKMPLMESV